MSPRDKAIGNTGWWPTQWHILFCNIFSRPPPFIENALNSKVGKKKPSPLAPSYWGTQLGNTVLSDINICLMSYYFSIFIAWERKPKLKWALYLIFFQSQGHSIPYLVLDSQNLKPWVKSHDLLLVAKLFAVDAPICLVCETRMEGSRDESWMTVL